MSARAPQRVVAPVRVGEGQHPQVAIAVAVLDERDPPLLGVLNADALARLLRPGRLLYHGASIGALILADARLMT